MSWLTRTLGLSRSLAIYYGQVWKEPRRRTFYRQLIAPGSLCFDIGAHVGNRIGSWRALGARVVAVEPQPDFARLLRVLYGRDEQVTLLEVAVGREGGHQPMLISTRAPTVSTLSADWVQQVRADPRFDPVEWDRQVNVKVETLDSLIDRHGVPAFCKIDVEGLELDVLQGLSRPIPLSFEYLPVAKDRAMACLERAYALGLRRFRVSRREEMKWHTDRWHSREEMLTWLAALPVHESSGDVYALPS